MPGLSSLTTIWNSVKEVDLRPINEEASKGVQIIVVGDQTTSRATLVDTLRRDPARPEILVSTPIWALDVAEAIQMTGQASAQAAPGLAPRLAAADLIVLVIGSDAKDDLRERELAKRWADAGKRVLVLIDPQAGSTNRSLLEGWVNWGQRRVLFGKVESSTFLERELTPAVLDLLPDSHLALGRHFPLFRVAIAHRLINDTCLSNAVYSISTGLAEIVPVLDVPLNATDLFVLTKTQAFLVYKLGLALGFSTRWQDYVTEFSSVLGGGFIWRQVARSLIGLVPGYGIIPKVGIAYAGTFVVGNVVLQWYLTGRHINSQQMKALYVQAFERGKDVARSLLKKIPPVKISLGARKGLPALPRWTAIHCPDCGKKNSAKAKYCQYCGRSLGQIEIEEDTGDKSS